MSVLSQFAFLKKGILYLCLGHSVKIPLGHQQSLWFSNQEIADASLLGNTSLIHPNKRGIVYISGLSSNFQNPQKVHVLKKKHFQLLKNCKKDLFSFSGNNIFYEKTDFMKLKDNCYLSDLKIPKKNYLIATPHFKESERKLIKKGFIIRNSFWENGKRVLQLDDMNKSSLNTLKETIYPLDSFVKIETKKASRPGRTLLFALTLFEFSKSKASKYGLELPKEVSISSKVNFQASLDGNSWAKIHSGFSSGHGKILAKPIIRTHPGESALFVSGGEIPIRNKGENYDQTEWKNYGLKIKLTPSNKVETGAGEITVKLNFSLSEPDLSTSINGIPGIISRSIQSKFDLRTNETTLLSSLLNVSKGKEKDSSFILGELPVIGNLFSNRAKNSHHRELYLAIKPTWEERNYDERDF